MADQKLPVGYIEAGREFCEALNKLGVSLDALAWARLDDVYAYDGKNILARRNQWHLVAVTDVVDTSGVMAFNELLFRAYNASALPKEISPFIVAIMSSKSNFAQNLQKAIARMPDPEKSDLYRKSADGSERKLFSLKGKTISTKLSGYWFEKKWIYKLAVPSASINAAERNQKASKEWQEFQRNVDALAA